MSLITNLHIPFRFCGVRFMTRLSKSNTFIPLMTTFILPILTTRCQSLGQLPNSAYFLSRIKTFLLSCFILKSLLHVHSCCSSFIFCNNLGIWDSFLHSMIMFTFYSIENCTLMEPSLRNDLYCNVLNSIFRSLKT